MTTARRVTVRGRVQGVSYRDGARREAGRLGVAGWARNEDDGSVQVHAEGEPGALEAFVGWCGRGPRHAEVADVQVAVVEPEGMRGFAVR